MAWSRKHEKRTLANNIGSVKECENLYYITEKKNNNQAINTNWD